MRQEVPYAQAIRLMEPLSERQNDPDSRQEEIDEQIACDMRNDRTWGEE